MKLEILGELGQEKKLENIAKAVNFAREKVENLPEKELLKCIKQLGFDRIYVDLSEDLLWMDFDSWAERNYDSYEKRIRSCAEYWDGIHEDINHYPQNEPLFYNIKIVSFVLKKNVDVEIFLTDEEGNVTNEDMTSFAESNFGKIAKKIENTALGTKMIFDLKLF